MEDSSEVERFVKNFSVPFAILLDPDGDATEAFRIRPIPANFGIAKGGQVIFRTETVMADDMPGLLARFPDRQIAAMQTQAVSKGPGRGFLDKLPFLAAILAGILTFLSPCILPLIPAYITLVGGFALEDVLIHKNLKDARATLIIHTVMFGLGFGTVFTLFGLTASALGQTLSAYQTPIRIVGGALMILFGLHLTGAFKIMPLYREFRLRVNDKPPGLLGSFTMGIVFAAGWTPCVGPVLSTILIYSATQETMLKGALLLAAYSLGIGIPFIIASAFLGQFAGFLKKIKPYYATIELASGALLVILGLLLITNKFVYLIGLLPNFTLI